MCKCLYFNKKNPNNKTKQIKNPNNPFVLVSKAVLMIMQLTLVAKFKTDDNKEWEQAYRKVGYDLISKNLTYQAYIFTVELFSWCLQFGISKDLQTN